MWHPSNRVGSAGPGRERRARGLRRRDLPQEHGESPSGQAGKSPEAAGHAEGTAWEERRQAGWATGTAMVAPFEGRGAGGNSYQGPLCVECCPHLTPQQPCHPVTWVGSLRDRKGKRGHPTRRAGEIFPVCERGTLCGHTKWESVYIHWVPNKC